MSDIGQQFREARERRKATLSQAAEATRIKSTHLEAMEQNRFDVFAAPIYARGFIRTYAEYLELDSKPLVEAYQAQSAPAAHPQGIPIRSINPSTSTLLPSPPQEFARVEIAPEVLPEPSSIRLEKPAAPEASAPATTEDRPIAAENLLPVLGGILGALLLILTLFHCTRQEGTPAATQPERRESILIESPTEPFFPLRSDAPSGTNTP